VNIDTSFLSSGEESAHCASVPAPEDTPKTTRRISQCSSDKVLFASTNEYATKRLFEQSGEAQNSDNAIKRGDNVYVVSRGGNASSNTQLEWLPGRVWDVKVKQELSDSPVKTYDVVFDNNDVERRYAAPRSSKDPSKYPASVGDTASSSSSSTRMIWGRHDRYEFISLLICLFLSFWLSAFLS